MSLPVNVTVTFCVDVPVGLADDLAVIVGDFDAGVVAGLEEFDEPLPHADAATATATRPSARGRGARRRVPATDFIRRLPGQRP